MSKGDFEFYYYKFENLREVLLHFKCNQDSGTEGTERRVQNLVWIRYEPNKNDTDGITGTNCKC